MRQPTDDDKSGPVKNWRITGGIKLLVLAIEKLNWKIESTFWVPTQQKKKK